jgi:cytochrome b561
MATLHRPTGYSTAQVALHWTIAVLVILQLIIGEDIVPAYRAFRRGTEISADALFDANIHVYVGIAVLVLALARLGLRLWRGVPAYPEGGSKAQRIVAGTVHGLLYLAILGMPVTGALAWFLGVGAAGEVHELAKPVIIAAVVLHTAGALWQHFYARTDVLTRMLRPQRSRA